MKLSRRLFSTILLLLFIMSCFMLVTNSLLVEGSGPFPCNFPAGIYCEDFSFDVEHNRFNISIENGLGRDLILTDFHLWSEEGAVECWQSDGSLYFSHKERKDIIMECTPLGENGLVYGRFNLNVSYLYVNNSNTTHSMRGEVYVSRETPTSKLPIGEILIVLVYLLVIGALWGQVKVGRSRRGRLTCLCWGILGSLVVGVVVSWGLVLSAAFKGIPLLFSTPITFVVLAFTFGQAPHLISHKVKRRSFYVGVLRYALALSMLHSFALLVWYFGILTPY